MAALPPATRQSILARHLDQLPGLKYNWEFWGRRDQLPPTGEWTYWLLMAGRGFGKTRTGAEWVRKKSETQPIIHLIAPTASDLRKVMIEGSSGILSCFPPDRRPRYEPSKSHKITFPSGNIAYGFSADEPERLRGPQAHAIWADELAAWKYPEAWDQAQFGLRLGENPQAIITTTPRPVATIKALVKDPSCSVTRGTTYDNRANLAPSFYSTIIRKYEGTRMGRQELNAELLDDVPGALWTRALIDATRVTLGDVRWHQFARMVVAIDPAVTANEDSDLTGIVVAGLTPTGHVLIIDDLSCKESPLGWARVAIAAYKSRQADRIIGEVNNGGDLVEGNIRAVDPYVSFRAVRASRGKAIRAEPVAALYEQGRVHHVGSFPALEDEMCGWSPQTGEKSPDRMDALVWAVTDLVVDQEQVERHHQMGEQVIISPI